MGSLYGNHADNTLARAFTWVRKVLVRFTELRGLGEDHCSLASLQQKVADWKLHTSPQIAPPICLLGHRKVAGYAWISADLNQRNASG